MVLNAYRVTDDDWYAAETFEDAVALAAADMGCAYEAAVDWGAATGEPEPMENELRFSVSRGAMTVREALAAMDGPGSFASTNA